MGTGVTEQSICYLTTHSPLAQHRHTPGLGNWLELSAPIVMFTDNKVGDLPNMTVAAYRNWQKDGVAVSIRSVTFRYPLDRWQPRYGVVTHPSLGLKAGNAMIIL